MIGLVGLISMVFLEDMSADWVESLRAWAFMMRSMLADQPYSPVTRQQGESARRLETLTFSTLSSRTSLVAEMSFLPSYSLSCWTRYSSMGSTMYTTSYPFFLSFSRKGEFSTDLLDSPVT